MFWFNVKGDKGTDYRENHRITNSGIDGYKDNIIVDERHAVKICENCITDLCDRSNRPKNQK